MEQHRASERLKFLTQATASISSSLDLPTALSNIVNSAVPAFADWCVVHYLERRDRIQRVSSRVHDPEISRMVDAVRALGTADTSIPDPIRDVIRTGKPLVLAKIEDRHLEAHSRDEKHLALLRQLHLESILVLPIVPVDQPIGALSFISATPARRYSPADEEVAAELARQAGLAIERCRLFGQARDAIRLRDDLLSVVSHDLKNPVTSVLLSADMIAQRNAGRDSVIDRALGAIRHSIQSMDALIRVLLDVGRVEAGSLEIHPEPTDLQAMIDATVQVLRPLADQKRIRIEASLTERFPVKCDPERIHQVLSNIVSNAIKYSPPATSIEITVRRDEGSTVTVCVRDQGPGIAKDELAHVFDRFWQARPGKDQGAGLGLYISRSLVEAHGGKIWVESELDEGSTFCFRIPERAE